MSIAGAAQRELVSCANSISMSQETFFRVMQGHVLIHQHAEDVKVDDS